MPYVAIDGPTHFNATATVTPTQYVLAKTGHIVGEFILHCVGGGSATLLISFDGTNYLSVNAADPPLRLTANVSSFWYKVASGTQDFNVLYTLLQYVAS